MEKKKIYVVFRIDQWETYPEVIGVFQKKEDAIKETEEQNKGLSYKPFFYEEHDLL